MGISEVLVMIAMFGQPFLDSGDPETGSIMPDLKLQRHLKADIALALATKATGEQRYANAARADLLHLRREYMREDGALWWVPGGGRHFFECHQCWYAIACDLAGLDPGRAVAFLDRFYPSPGVPFGYRSIDDDGVPQTQTPWKGSYEIGACLWALPLVGRGTQADEIAAWVAGPVHARGFFDDGRWIDRLHWGGKGWGGWTAHEWKYGLEAQEGALAYLKDGGRAGALRDQCRDYAYYTLAQIHADGALIDAGTYEYGVLLSSLALGAMVFDGALGDRCLEAAKQVAAFIDRTITPGPWADRAMVLRGLSWLALAMGEERYGC